MQGESTPNHEPTQRRICEHMKAFVDIYANSTITLIGGQFGDPIFVACTICPNTGTAMIETGEYKVQEVV